jgi:protein O-mannosyl-transferase
MIKTGKFFPFLIICLAVLVVYLPSFSGEFILDDTSLIESNTYIREWHSFGSYLSQEDGYNINLANIHSGYYRPLVNLSYTLDYKIWGINGPGFRLTNLILHLFVCIALFCFYELILKKRNIALLLAFIFALHPIATESVSWAAARNNMLTTLFSILSFIFYIKAYKEEKLFYYAVSILFFSFSIFSKEFGLMLLPIFFIYQRTLHPQKTYIIIELREYLPYIIISAFYFYFRHNATGSLLSPSGLSDFFVHLYYVPYVLLFNIRLIFFPYNMHSFIIEQPDSYLNIGVICAILGFVLLIWLLWKYRQNRMSLFPALAFLLAIFPASGLIPTACPSLIAMRWLYYPMAFILIILAEPFEKLTKSRGLIFFSIIACIVLYLGVNSHMLNRYLWHSNKVFAKQEVLNFDSNYYASVLAHNYLVEGKYELSERYYKKNLGCGMTKPQNYIQYAILLLKKGDVRNSLLNLSEAEQYLLTTSDFGMILNIKGMAYFKSNDPDKAIRKYKEAILFLPEESEIWVNMGLVYGEMGEHANAADSFKKAIRLQSKSDTVYNNLALSFILNHECQKAVTLLDRKGFRENDWAKELLKRAKRCSGRIN